MNKRPHNPEIPLLEARDLTLHFAGQRRPAVDRVSFKVEAGRSLGLVGASGAGKSSVARLLMKLHDPDSGAVLFNGNNVARMDERQLRASRRAVHPLR